MLRKEIDEQTTKIDTLRKALQNAAASFGENDRRTQNWQIQLNNAIAAVLSRSPMTVKRSLNELETAGLIMRVRQGVGEPNRIYVLIPGKEDAALA